MTKKRIADLLKEEVEKPTDADAAKATSSTPSSAAKKSTATAAKSSGETKSRTRKRASATTSAAKASTTKSSTAAKTTAVKTDAKSEGKAAEKTAEKATAAADKKVAELEAALKKSAAQVSALQEDVETHQERVFELKDSLKSTQNEGKKKDTQLKKVTAELAEAKQTILKLTEVNKEKEALAIAQQSAIEKAPEKAAKKSEPKPAERQISVYRRPYTSYKSIPEYAIQRGTPAAGQSNSMMDDDDIGWVD